MLLTVDFKLALFAVTVAHIVDAKKETGSGGGSSKK